MSSSFDLVRGVALTTAFFASMCCSLQAAADGPFDPTFRGGGFSSYLLGKFASPSGLTEDVRGNLLVASTLGRQLAVSRHTSDGQLDPTFGDTGIASNFLSLDTGDVAFSTSIAMDHGGRIVLGGGARTKMTCSTGGPEDVRSFIVIRVLDDQIASGRADSSFGTFGIAHYGDCSRAMTDVADVLVGSDNSVYAVGGAAISGSPKAVILKWTDKGQLDSSFGDGGIAVADATLNSDGTSAAIDTSGRLVVGVTHLTADTESASLVRLATNGEIDSSFGTSGVIDLGTISYSVSRRFGQLCCVRIDGQGRTVVAGMRVSANTSDLEGYNIQAFIRRYTHTGVRDMTFGNRGEVVLELNLYDQISNLAIDARDRPVLAGTSRSSYDPVPSTAVLQLNADGSLNQAVGFGGSLLRALPTTVFRRHCLSIRAVD